MGIQLEDYIDVLKVQFPEFDLVVLVNHSNDHDRLQPDRLNMNKILVRYGGKEPKMRSSKLTSASFLVHTILKNMLYRLVMYSQCSF